MNQISKNELWIIVDDLLVQKEIKSVLNQQNLPYNNIININSNDDSVEVNYEKLADDLNRLKHQDKNFIIFLKPPVAVINNDGNTLEALSEANLTMMQNWITRFNQIHKILLKHTHNCKSKIICLTSPLTSNNLFNELVINYAFNYYQGVSLELKPYSTSLSLIYRDANQPWVTIAEQINKVLSEPTPKCFYTNLNKSKIKKLITKNKTIAKNELLVWDKKRKEKKVAIVTGASGGLGLEIAKFLIDNNWKVYSFSRSKQNKFGITFIQCDLSNVEDIRMKTNWLLEKEEAIHLLVNNSGYGLGASMENVGDNEFADMYALNVLGSMRMIRRLAPAIAKAEGFIFNIGSVAGIFPIPFQVGYSLTKVMIDCYTDMLVNYLNKKNIRICNVMPGDTKTQFAAHRKISDNELNQRYYQRIKASIAKMEKDERHGHNPSVVVKSIYKRIHKPFLPVRYTVGKYKIMYSLYRILGYQLTNEILYNLYAKKDI